MFIPLSGLNTVETYVPWNLHEESKGSFDFQGMLDLVSFVRLAEKLGLYVILRPGPYICSEWDWGGLPAWLLRDPHMRVRTMYKPYLNAVDDYFGKLLPMLVDLQYLKGGPVVAIQIENEYGSFGADTRYLLHILSLFEKHGFSTDSSLFFTSDNEAGLETGYIPGILMTVNCQTNVTLNLNVLRSLQPDRPVMVMEFWTGWFDHWGEKHGGFPLPRYHMSLREILTNHASVNLYMFHGGTNFGFMNGANGAPTFPHYKPDVSSYDYDAPLTENGALTPKWQLTRKMLEEFAESNPKLRHCFQFVDPPAPIKPKSYGVVEISQMMDLDSMLTLIDDVSSSETLMEMEVVNRRGFGGSHDGQNYGFILYRKEVAAVAEMRFRGFVADRASVLLNGKEVETIDFTMKDARVRVDVGGEFNTLDILVENLGRINYGQKIDNQRKGLSPDQVVIDDVIMNDVKIYCLDFKMRFVEKVMTEGRWRDYDIPEHQAPGLYRAVLTIDGDPSDTFLHLEPFDWHHGIVLVNGFNLGRYWQIGPQKTLYIPAPLLVKGANDILVFEIHRPYLSIEFRDEPTLS